MHFQAVNKKGFGLILGVFHRKLGKTNYFTKYTNGTSQIGPEESSPFCCVQNAKVAFSNALENVNFLEKIKSKNIKKSNKTIEKIGKHVKSGSDFLIG